MNRVNINGHILTEDNYPQHFTEKALLETMFWENGTIALWQYHYARLQNSFMQLGYNKQLFNDTFLLNEISKTTEANHLTEAKVRLVICINGEQLFFLIECIPYHHNDIPFRLYIARNVIKEANATSGIKFHERGLYNKAMLEAKDKACDDALLLNQYDRIAETTIANIFWKKGNHTFTPPLSEGCVAGVYRQFYIDNNNVQEAVLTMEALLEVDEIFITNALRGIIQVEQIAQ